MPDLIASMACCLTLFLVYLAAVSEYLAAASEMFELVDSDNAAHNNEKHHIVPRHLLLVCQILSLVWLVI
jgi:hypothetical protein